MLHGASTCMAGASDSCHKEVETVHGAAARIITGCCHSTPTHALPQEAGLLPLVSHAEAGATNLHERALRQRQATPLANLARGHAPTQRIKLHSRGGDYRRTWRRSATSLETAPGSRPSVVKPTL